MISMQQILNDVSRYFSDLNESGIDGADHCSISYLKNTDDDGFGDSLYVTFFQGEERIQSWRVCLTNGERTDLT